MWKPFPHWKCQSLNSRLSNTSELVRVFTYPLLSANWNKQHFSAGAHILRLFAFCISLGSYFKMSTAENVLLIFYWLEWIDGVKFMRVDIFSLFKHAWTGLMSVYSTIDFETILQNGDTRNDLRFKTKSSKLQIVKVAQSFEIWVKFYK